MQIGGKHIASALFWNLGGLFASRGATALFTLLLARMLLPEAFGLIAMVTVIFELSTILVTSGFSQAIIRAKEISQNDLNTTFLANLLFSTIIYLTLFFSANYIASFYQQEALSEIIRILGLILFINAIRIVPAAIYTRDINFKVQVRANIWSILISGSLAVFLAYTGAGVWSLVSQMVASSLVLSTILWCGCAWKPKLHFTLPSFLSLYRFSAHLMLENIMYCLYKNSYLLLIGYFFNAQLTGLYFFATKLSNIVSQQLTDAFQQVSFPAMSLIQDDNKQLVLKYRKIIQSLMFVIAPITLISAALSSVFFSILLDSKWQGAADYFCMLSLVAIFYPLHSMNINILNVKGRSDLVLRIGLIKIFFNLIILSLTITQGIKAVIIGQIVGSIFGLFPNTYYSKKLIGYGLNEQITDVLKPIFSSLIAGLSAYLLTLYLVMNKIFVLILAGIIGVSVYLLVSYLIKSDGLQIVIRRFKRRCF